MRRKTAGRWAEPSRPLAIATALAFLVSSAFPVAAGLSEDTSAFPRWWGFADVALAFVLAVLAMMVVGVAQERVTPDVREATYRAYRILLHGILALGALFFVAGDRIVWIHCLTGFGWRAWLLLYCLPAWLAALGAGALTRDAHPSPETSGPA